MTRILFAALAAFSLPAFGQGLTLHGASQFNDEHAFTKAMVRFDELMKKYSGGKSVNFVLHKNSELGLEKQYFEYMAQGKAVDYAIVSPAHMSTFSKAAPFIDAPFVFRDLAHWNKVLEADLLKPIADEIAQKADVMLVGYAGGGTRNIFANKPTKNLAEMKGLKVRGPTRIGTRFLNALGVTPVQMPLPQVPEAIAKGVIDGAMVPWEGTPPIKLHEIAKYALDNAPGQPKMSNSIFVIAMNPAKYDSLPADLKKVLDANTGLAWSAQIGKVFDGTTEPAKKLAAAANNVFDTLSPQEYAKMQTAADAVAKEWIGDVGAKGANGQQLLDDAKALIRQHGG